MPREFSIVQKRKWLKAFEGGQTPTKIADDDVCDIRTVRKGIEEARWERETNLKRGELIKEALINHNELLTNVLKELITALVALPINQLVPWSDASSISMVEIPGGKIEFETSPFLTTRGIKLEIEQKLEWELLNEHLRSTDPLKKTFISWKKSLASHIQARIDFKRKLAAALIRETGLKILEKPSVELRDMNSEAPFIDSYAIDILTQELLSRLINPHEAIDFPDIITIADDGKIRYSNAPLIAYAPQNPDECKAGILRVIYQPDISRDMGLIDTYRAMEEATGKAKRAVQELILLGLIPGRCRICRRLGM